LSIPARNTPELNAWHAGCSLLYVFVRSSQAPQAGRSVAVALFQDEASAQHAVQTLKGNGVDESQVATFVGDAQADLVATLTGLGVPDGEARYYAEQVNAGQTLVVAASADYASAREILLTGGGRDVQSQGAEFVRSDGAGVSRGIGARPVDVTGHWPDVASRYEMLFGQHYGTTDTSWAQMEPVYRYAWEMANAAQYRGRPWSEVAHAVQQDWTASHPERGWQDVEGAIHDVWDDVADEATTGAEGGQDRRVARQAGDQAGPARTVPSP
jgi:hypothetical protein